MMTSEGRRLRRIALAVLLAAVSPPASSPSRCSPAPPLLRAPSRCAEVVRRFQTAWLGGRYTPSLDRGAPPGISWASLQHYARMYLELSAGDKSGGFIGAGGRASD